MTSPVPTSIKQQGLTPLQQGRTPSHQTATTPPVSTPFSHPTLVALSPPGPKSSPQHVKKSPAASALVGLQGSMAAFNFNSPSTSAAMGAIGSLGMSSDFDIGLDPVALRGLDNSLNPFLDNVDIAQDDPPTRDDDVIKVLETIIKKLSAKQGFVSDAGLVHLAQRLGFEVLSEEHTTATGRKTTTLAIAGLAIALDIVLQNNIVLSTSLAYHGAASSVSRHLDAANRILLRDLQLCPRQSPLTKTLDNFAANFKRLSVLDRLSIVPGLDCFEALAGIHVSLERLHHWDLSKLRQNPDMAAKSDDFVIDMATCTRHGLPVMHSRGMFGLALQYWKELHLVPPPNDELADFAREYEKVWSLVISCASGDRLRCPPVRISENWISVNFVKDDSMDAGPLALDWQEPDNISLPQPEENKDATVDLLEPDISTVRVPEVVFIVSFDPPLVLPQNDWRRLYVYANLQPPHLEISQRHDPDTYDSLLFPIPPGTRRDPSEPRSITSRRLLNLYSAKDKKLHTVEHENVLYVYKPVYSQVMSEMPFSHPRQLIDMLPVLRQYALLSSLLENSFGKERPGSPSRTGDDDVAEMMKPLKTETHTVTLEEQFAAFMAVEPPANEVETTKKDKTRKMAVTVWVHPSPRLQVVFPFDTETANIILRILEEGTVEMVADDLIGHGRLRKEVSRQFLCKNLEKMEDLCKWAEWIRIQLLP